MPYERYGYTDMYHGGCGYLMRDMGTLICTMGDVGTL